MTSATHSSVVVRILKGDELSALISGESNLQKDIDNLWPPKGIITCGPENRFVVIFETETQEHIIALAKIIEIQTGKGYIIGSVHDVVVDKDFQGKRLGLFLMTSLIRYCKDEGFHKLELTCRPARIAANNLYQKVGFTMLASACDGGTNYYRYTF